MTIERIDRPHWGAKPKIRELKAGYDELILDSFGIQEVLHVNSPDELKVTRRSIFDRDEFYDHDYINKEHITRWRGIALFKILVGNRIEFKWRPTEEQDSSSSSNLSTEAFFLL